MDKNRLINQLNDLAEKEDNPFKKRAYLNAGRIIREMGKEEFKKREGFKDIEGIGEAINKKILQFKETGFIEKWRDLFEADSQ